MMYNVIEERARYRRIKMDYDAYERIRKPTAKKTIVMNSVKRLKDRIRDEIEEGIEEWKEWEEKC